MRTPPTVELESCDGHQTTFRIRARRKTRPQCYLDHPRQLFGSRLPPNDTTIGRAWGRSLPSRRLAQPPRERLPPSMRSENPPYDRNGSLHNLRGRRRGRGPPTNEKKTKPSDTDVAAPLFDDSRNLSCTVSTRFRASLPSIAADTAFPCDIANKKQARAAK